MPKQIYKIKSYFIVFFIACINIASTFIRGYKTALVDVYIQVYVVNGHEVISYADYEKTHESYKDFYMQTVVKGTMGGPVHYRFYLEHDNLSFAEAPDSAHTKYNVNTALVFQNSSSEQIDSANAVKLSPGIFERLPGTFTNPSRPVRHK